MDKILKVALTIMLMENESEIKPIHLMEAMTFQKHRILSERCWNMEDKLYWYWLCGKVTIADQETKRIDGYLHSSKRTL